MHANLGPRNILLNESFDPKLSGFQWATSVNETDCVHVNVLGGYMYIGYSAPEYERYGKLSTKVYVYSLGVLVLETITGRSTSDYIPILEYVRRNWLNGSLSNIIDPRIDVDSSSMTRFFEIGLLCVQEDAADRPTMHEVVSMLLDSSSITIPVSKMRAMVTREHSNSISTSVDDYDTSTVEEFTPYMCPR
ncbi:putative cysteine-rich receptor-like protein kinase 20 isoform X1 [Bidens hawaiensis]|uniref:putative cysteine-rich receptor-like protein kinase 20 isoform X1 n=1 Tax=Bidens hawaiensis TaxID=980011 RepID=UPI00404B6120